MAKKLYRCSSCKYETPTYFGVCKQCEDVGTCEEISESNSSSGKKVGMKTNVSSRVPTTNAESITSIKPQKHLRLDTGIGEFNRVLGGGLVPGGVVLLAGEPGAGKSTLLGHLAKSLSDKSNTVLYISGEESVEQIRLRSERINSLNDRILVAAEKDVTLAIGHIEMHKPDLVIIDSIQTLASPDEPGRAGGVAQVNEVSSLLVTVAKQLHIPMVLVGHVTKDGNIAGPRTIEHLVDVVLQLESADNSPLRILRASKNRYGNVDEVGCFEHADEGLLEVKDPSKLLLGDRTERTSMSGVVTCIIMEGIRAMPIEIQALAVTSSLSNPRRVANGLEHQRSLMVEAITEKHAGVMIMDRDVFVSTVGGIKVKEPGTDLALALAIASSSQDIQISTQAIAIGELELSGEVRAVAYMSQRIKEAVRMGFQELYIPKGASKYVPKGADIKVYEVKTIREAVILMKEKSMKK